MPFIVIDELAHFFEPKGLNDGSSCRCTHRTRFSVSNIDSDECHVNDLALGGYAKRLHELKPKIDAFQRCGDFQGTAFWLNRNTLSIICSPNHPRLLSASRSANYQMDLTERAAAVNLTQQPIFADFNIIHDSHQAEFEKDGYTSGEK
jgi:hypothetical protein